MNCSSSLFAQILQMIPRGRFVRAVHECKAERHSKGFTCWDQMVSMLFCQFAQCKSLREISDGLAVTLGKLNHLAMKSAPAKSTLAYANQHRPWEVYEKLFYDMLALCYSLSPGKKEKFKFKNKLLSMDASLIDLCLSLFPWAEYRQTKGAVKLHMMLDHDGYFPVFAHVTEGVVNELKIAQVVEIPKGSIVTLDRGYIDYGLFAKWTAQGVFFVTRLKNKSLIEVVKELPVNAGSNVIGDCLVRLTGYLVKKKCPDLLRIVVVWDEKNQNHTSFLTNLLDFEAETIGEIYRDRWEIELFFKTLKQRLKVKTFIGTSANALKIQIWTALITMLLIKFMQFKSRCALPLCRLLALLRLNLFTYRDLWRWLCNPFETPPESPPVQLGLVF